MIAIYNNVLKPSMLKKLKFQARICINFNFAKEHEQKN